MGFILRMAAGHEQPSDEHIKCLTQAVSCQLVSLTPGIQRRQGRALILVNRFQTHSQHIAGHLQAHDHGLLGASGSLKSALVKVARQIQSCVVKQLADDCFFKVSVNVIGTK